SKSIAKALQNDLEQRGVNFYVDVQLSEEHVSTKDNSIEIQIEEELFVFDKLLVAIGRKPNKTDIGLNNTKIKLTDKDHIDVNEYQQKEDKNIYATVDSIDILQHYHANSIHGSIY